MASTSPSTPLMRQYHALKQQKADHLLLFRLGDFFELFFDDAVIASRTLGITLTSRNKEKGQPIPMCGVPAHSIDSYLSKLIAKGHKVAIADQIEDAKKTTKLVRRDITRIITPGTATDAGMLDAGRNNYLGAVITKDDRAGFAYVDISTGEFRMTELPPQEVNAALDQIDVREILEPVEASLFADRVPENNTDNGKRLKTKLESWVFDLDYSERTLCSHFKLHSIDGLGAKNHPIALSAAGAILHYLRETQRATLEHLDVPHFYVQYDWMILDALTVRHLELIEPLFGSKDETTLISIVDRTCTSMGKRLLRQWVLRPAFSILEINSRLDGVNELRNKPISLSEIRSELDNILDIERLLAKVTLATTNPRELLSLGSSFARLPSIHEHLGVFNTPRMSELTERLDELADVKTHILTTLTEDPPIRISDGGVIRMGVDSELDSLREIRKNNRSYVAQIESREREKTGIQSLKVRFNNVFGFYIEVSKSNLQRVPADYSRKQTLVNAERFITPELKEYEHKILEAEQCILEREERHFEKLRTTVSDEAKRIRITGVALAELDVLCSLAEVASENGYTRPIFNTNTKIQIDAGRHPVIEKLTDQQAGERFIANDCYLDNSENLLALITGPNMGGKSTYLRQTALIAILAQIGSFVPAEHASLPLIDRIFTRIGATDNLAMGRSTFMVEMTETAEILNTTTQNSLILLDEIGRGTATYDGLAIAWAVVEYIHEKCRAKTLFATHYHELTELAKLLPGVTNLHVSVKESGDRVIFLHKVDSGQADRSYGIEVARLAGLPIAVIERARQVLAHHENTEQLPSSQTAPVPLSHQKQENIARKDSDPKIIKELRKMDLNSMRPIEALALLEQWKQAIDQEDDPNSNKETDPG